MKKIIGIAGEMASGKETITQYLEDKYNVKKFRMSDIMRDILSIIHRNIDRKNLVKVSMVLREAFGNDIFILSLVEDIKKSTEDIIVVDGVRRMAELEELNKLDNFKFIYLKADFKKRYERLIERNEKEDDKIKTFEEFKKDHELETEQSILELESKADFVVKNDSTLADLYLKIDNIIKNVE